MDHNLKKAYDKVAKQEEQVTPRKDLGRLCEEVIKEYYFRMRIDERAAFYVKELDLDQEPPKYNSLKTVGVVENPKRILHTIHSSSVIPALETVMSRDVTGWGTIKGVSLDVLARDFVALGVSDSDLRKIWANRDKYTEFEQKVKKPEVFNLADTLIDDICNSVDIEADPSKLKLIFKRVFDEEGTIAGTAVGKGEIAITLFSNAKKGLTGDLVLPNGAVVEVKGKGGRLGPAEWSQNNTAKELYKFLKNRAPDQKKELKFNRELIKLKTKVRSFAEELSQDSSYVQTFTSKLRQALEQIADNLEDPHLLDLAKQNGFREIYRGKAGEQQAWKDFVRLGYVNEDPEIPSAPIQWKYVLETQTKIRQFLTTAVFEKGKLENVMSKSATMEKLPTSSFVVAVQDFFLNDLGLSPEEAADAFMLTKSMDRDVEQFRPEIQEFFKKHYSKMVQGDKKYLQAAVFAFQLAIYATAGEGEHFQHFMIVNNSTFDALSFTVEGKSRLFTYLADAFLHNANRLRLDIKADGRQGASAITLL